MSGDSVFWIYLMKCMEMTISITLQSNCKDPFFFCFSRMKNRISKSEIHSGSVFNCHIYFLSASAIYIYKYMSMASGLRGFHWVLQWRCKECNGVSCHRRFDCLFRHKSKKTWKLRVTGPCEAVVSRFPSHRASNTEKVSICWRHHGM